MRLRPAAPTNSPSSSPARSPPHSSHAPTRHAGRCGSCASVARSLAQSAASGAAALAREVAGDRPLVAHRVAADHDPAREPLGLHAHVQHGPRREDRERRGAAAEHGVAVVEVGRERRKQHDAARRCRRAPRPPWPRDERNAARAGTPRVLFRAWRAPVDPPRLAGRRIGDVGPQASSLRFGAGLERGSHDRRDP